MSNVYKKPLTIHGKLYKLEIKNEAIICPTCGRKIRGVRLLPGTVIRNMSVMCQGCKTVSIVNIDQASATYSSPRH
jgi:hypothetical protein